jgi:hypothetical protein
VTCSVPPRWDWRRAPCPLQAAHRKGSWGIHVSLAPLWFDPAKTQALITPFMVLYALHDAMVRPMPGNVQAPCLAQSWCRASGVSIGGTCCLISP